MLYICWCLLIGIHKTRRWCLMWWLILSCQESRCFLNSQIWSHQFLFNCCSRFNFFCFFFTADYIVDTHILNLIFRVFGKFINMLLVWCCGNSWCFSIWFFWGDNNQFISMSFIKTCLLFILALWYHMRGALFLIRD